MSEEEVVQETQDRFKSLENEASKTSLKLESITDGFNARGIPTVRFVDDIGEFATSFSPLASAELLIGAYSDLFAKFKSYEESLSQKSEWNLGKYAFHLHVWEILTSHSMQSPIF
jgi:hypothetical protein